MMHTLPSLTLIFIVINKQIRYYFLSRIIDSTQVKSCRSIWQVFAKRQNSRLFLTLAELQLSNLSKPTCVLHR